MIAQAHPLDGRTGDAPERCIRSGTTDVFVTRRFSETAPVILNPSSDGDHALLAIATISTDATIWVDGTVVHDGRLCCGTFLFASPGQIVSAAFRQPISLIRFSIPKLTCETFTDTLPATIRDPVRPVRDPIVELLALTIVNAFDPANRLDDRFLEGVTTAVLARVSASRVKGGVARIGANGLVPWRLKRVLDFVEANLDEPLALADMAAAAGLSRMHFAAQFRLATGQRPHAYVSRRRIERAQELLKHTRLPLVQIALAVGFQTQAHFTTIFRQLAGEPPGQWRRREAAATDLPFSMVA